MGRRGSFIFWIEHPAESTIKSVLASECSPIYWHLRWVRRVLEKRRVIKSDGGSLNPAV